MEWELALILATESKWKIGANITNKQHLCAHWHTHTHTQHRNKQTKKEQIETYIRLAAFVFNFINSTICFFHSLSLFHSVPLCLLRRKVDSFTENNKFDWKGKRICSFVCYQLFCIFMCSICYLHTYQEDTKSQTPINCNV